MTIDKRIASNRVLSEEDWETILHGLQEREGSTFLSREEVLRLLGHLGNPQDRTPSIHIVGTNGKGSVGAMLAAILHCAGKSVGHTSSPHLYDLTERCFINGVPQTRAEYLLALRTVHQRAVEANLAPTFFVLTLLASFLEFHRLGLDWMIIEAGLGGVDDATNVLSRPRANVLTSVGYDHVEILGHTLADIAKKKAGVAKSGVPFFAGFLPDVAIGVVREIARERQSPLYLYGEEFRWDEGSEKLRTSQGNYELSLKNLSLPANYQRRNAVLASRIAFALGFSEEVVHDGLSRVQWPGRCEELSYLWGEKTQTVLLDVAHNEEGMRALGEELSRRCATENTLVFILSMLDRKDYRQSLRNILSVDYPKNLRRVWVCTSSSHPNARAPSSLANYLREIGEGEVLEVTDSKLALERASEILGADSGRIVATGSVFLIADLRSLLTHRPVQTLFPLEN